MSFAQDKNQRTMKKIITMLVAAALVACAKESSEMAVPADNTANESISLEELAGILSEIPFGSSQVQEVYDAVSSSSDNGYDEEYTMQNLFSSPGSGVGEDDTSTKSSSYTVPLRDLISEYVQSLSLTKASDIDADEWLESLSSSDLQIYWPYSSTWDGSQLPVITYAPDSDADTLNVGYLIADTSTGERTVSEVVVSEEMAKERPVWVINRNYDSEYTSLELLRRSDPDWGNAGGGITVSSVRSSEDGDDTVKALYIKDFIATRNYDSWFAGASEFFIKCGSVEDFTASTEAELLLYEPTITDFMVVVKRSQIGDTIDLNTVLVSEWNEDLDSSIAFMMTEYDGGTLDTWDIEATVKLNSKSWGITVSIPVYTKDDIVWRGSMTKSYLEAIDGEMSSFGDVKLTFEIVEL